MDKKNVVLLDGSAFSFKNGITQGLKNKGMNVKNLSLGGTAALQNLYEL
ncbi:glycosyltransferase, partial [Campylobacter estrildidarum]